MSYTPKQHAPTEFPALAPTELDEWSHIESAEELHAARATKAALKEGGRGRILSMMDVLARSEELLATAKAYTTDDTQVEEGSEHAQRHSRVRRGPS
jgi:hypothetical protein